MNAFILSHFSYCALAWMLNKEKAGRKMCKYEVFPGPHFTVFGLNTRKYGSKETPYLNTF